MANDPATNIERILEQLRDMRADQKSLEQKLWGLVAAVFLLVVGYLFSQVQSLRGAPVAPSADGVGAAIDFVLSIFGM